ncbi:hypothetical protein KUL106_10090 [Alteromonas sp. KUL106]|nr:hypothetical protein KUL106_10090 [Alteromonas sp. KUL106]
MMGPEELSSLLSIAKKPNPLSVEPSQPESSTVAFTAVLEIEKAKAALANREHEKRDVFFISTSL